MKFLISPRMFRCCGSAREREEVGVKSSGGVRRAFLVINIFNNAMSRQS